MRTAIVVIKAAFPCVVLGAISLMLVLSMSCKEVETTQAQQQQQSLLRRQ